jgi:adenosine/AMP kinase
MELTTLKIEKPEPINFILGQTHFIKSVEDLHEALVTAVPGIKFGLARRQPDFLAAIHAPNDQIGLGEVNPQIKFKT